MAPAFFDILSLLDHHRIPLVIVTGRSLSWAHFLLTYFPYLGIVIAEGGGCVVYQNPRGGHRSRFMVGLEERLRLEEVCRELSHLHPRLPLSADSVGRVTDRAVELVDYLAYPQREDFDGFLDQNDISYVRSSVHVNFWCGEMSKAKASLEVLERDLGFEVDKVVFFGDAPNDKSMFRHFPRSVGVANIRSCLDGLEFLPATVLEGEDNEEALGVLGHLKTLLS